MHVTGNYLHRTPTHAGLFSNQTERSLSGIAPLSLQGQEAQYIPVPPDPCSFLPLKAAEQLRGQWKDDVQKVHCFLLQTFLFQTAVEITGFKMFI